jgi:hypothetical protein
MKKFLSLVAAASLVGVVAQAPVASAALCKTFAVPVSITNCTLPGGVGFASAFVKAKDVNKTKWEMGLNMFVGRTSSLLLLDRNGVFIPGNDPAKPCLAGDNNADGNWGATGTCTTGAGVPKTASFYISL